MKRKKKILTIKKQKKEKTKLLLIDFDIDFQRTFIRNKFKVYSFHLPGYNQDVHSRKKVVLVFSIAKQLAIGKSSKCKYCNGMVA